MGLKGVFRIMIPVRPQMHLRMTTTWHFSIGLAVFSTAASVICLSIVLATTLATGEDGPRPQPPTAAKAVGSPLERVRVLSPRPSGRWESVPTPIPLDAQRIVTHFETVLSAETKLRQPGVLVLPITDHQGRVRADGVGLCYQAMLAVERSTTPTQLLMDAETGLTAIQDGGCDRIGATINDRLRTACTRSAGAELAVAAALTDRVSTWQLTVSLYTLDGTHTSKRHPIPIGQINTIPGIIATDICDYLKITLSADQRLRMLKPQTTTDEASAMLGDLLRQTPEYLDDWIQYERFLRLNPDCVGAWQHLMVVSNDLRWHLEWLRRFNHTLDDPQLGLAVALHRSRVLGPEVSYRDLERLAIELPGNAAIPPAILWCCMNTGDLPAFDKALAAWRRARPGYLDCLNRGRLLIECAEKYPNDRRFTSTEVGTIVRRWQEEARLELQKAVELNPDGWQAHALLMSLATALGRPRDELERHFAAAVAVVPGHRPAYRCKLQFLSPHHHGTIEELASFAEDCVRTRRWDEGIPQLFLEAVRYATTDLRSSATSFTAYHNERLWQAAKVYRAEAEESGTADDQQLALNYFVYLAAVSGRVSEVANEIKLLNADYAQHTYLRSVFETPITFQLFKDMLAAEDNASNQTSEPALRLAVSAGNLDQAEILLAASPPPDRPRAIHPLGSATELARRLIKKRDVTLTPQDILTTFFVQGPSNTDLWPALDRHMGLLEVEKQAIVWRSRSMRTNSTLNLVFPVGIRHGVLSGEMEVTGSLSRVGILLHTRALRDIITVMYLPERKLVSVSRSRHEIATSPWDSQVISFRFEFGAKEDILEPLPGFRITTPVLDDIPSGFAFEVQDDGQGQRTAALRLRALRIQTID